MDVVAEAPALLAALFEDGGTGLLRAGGLGEDWPTALAHVPPEVLRVPPEGDVGLRQLTRIRDFWSSRNDLRPAVALTRGLLDVLAARVGSEHPDALVELATLGTLAERAGRVEEAAPLIEQALAQLRPQVGGRDLRLAHVSGCAARVRLRQGDLQGAERALEIAYRIRRAVAPPTAALVAAQLGEVRVRQGRPAEALALLEESWEVTRAQEGEGAPRTLARAQMLGTVYNQLERHTDAVRVLRPVHAGLGTGPSERRTSVAFDLGVALSRTGVDEEGLRLVEEAVRWTRRWGLDKGSPHPTLAGRLTLYARLLTKRQRVEEAEGLLSEALDADKQLFGDTSAQVAQRYAHLGRFLANQGRVDEAIGWLEPACSLLRSTLGERDPRTVEAADLQAALMVDRARRALAARDIQLAAELLRRGFELASAVLGHTHERTRELRNLQEAHRLH